MKASNYNTMKTKEEIIEPFIWKDNSGNPRISIMDCLKAMDEYARAALERAAKVGGVRQTNKLGSFSASKITDPYGNAYEIDRASITDIELP